MSGIGWYGDLGNLLVMPTVGKLHTFRERWKILITVIVPGMIKHRRRLLPVITL